MILPILVLLLYVVPVVYYFDDTFLNLLLVLTRIIFGYSQNFEVCTTSEHLVLWHFAFFAFHQFIIIFNFIQNMSSDNRSVCRLPLHIFTDLILHRDDKPYTPLELRAAITRKLEQVGRSSLSKSSNSGSVPTETSCMITTIGQLMRLTPPALLRALDPLLTNGEKNCSSFLSFFSMLYSQARLCCCLNLKP